MGPCPPLILLVPFLASISTMSYAAIPAVAPKQTIQKQSAASILSSLTASTPTQQHHTPAALKKPTPPPATPTSPKLDLGSPKESDGPPKRVPIPSANKSFQLFKKPALEKSERVRTTVTRTIVAGATLCVGVGVWVGGCCRYSTFCNKI